MTTGSIKIKYTQPSTRYFLTEFPEPIKLSAGMSASIAVTFAPVRLERYEDKIDFSTPGGGFSVSLRGKLFSSSAARHVELPTHLPARLASRRHCWCLYQM